jgi:(p)ppGpp synthase/HD superfamily hydrolase
VADQEILMEYFQDILKAAIFAAEAHKNQLRKYTNDPYIVHPIAVADLVKSARGTAQMVMAALLHDTIEDCSVSQGVLLQKFGDEVTRLVLWVTDQSKPSDGNRSKRKEIDRLHIADAPPEAKTIKLADMIDNTFSIVEHDPNFAKTYMAEKALLLPYLREGDERLFKMAQSQLDKYFAEGDSK